MTTNFYDTCSLLLKSGDLFEEENSFIISSITLKELERIKEDRNKDPEIKYAARHFLDQLLQPENVNKCRIEVFKVAMLEPLIEADLEINDDLKILATALSLKEDYDLTFITNDH